MTNLPSGFELIQAPPVRVVVRQDLSLACRRWLLGRQLTMAASAEPIAAGRGGAYRVTLPGGVAAVVRPCKRGGVLAPLLRDRYLGFHPRPLDELAVTVAARARGVPVPEVLAARVEGRGIYRGTLITAELIGMTPLITALRGAVSREQRIRFAANAGRSVGRMHRAGLYHADLNLWNILVAADAPDTEAAIVDLDRAWLATAMLPPPFRRRNLERFERSRRKLDPERTTMDDGVASAFSGAYATTLERACAS